MFVTSDVNVPAEGSSHIMLPCDKLTPGFSTLGRCFENGCNTCLVCTVDTDVVVIIIGKFHHLLTKNPSARVWSFGIGKVFAICYALGQSKSLALPFFHCFTGCDTMSGYFGKGKKLAWEAWKCYPDVTTAFTHMALTPYIELDTDSQYQAGIWCTSELSNQERSSRRFHGLLSGQLYQLQARHVQNL